jgi:hypothetical protein
VKTKKRAIDLVACKDGRKIAFEIETGKNTSSQIATNISKCLASGVDHLYLIATNEPSYSKLMRLLIEENLSEEPRISLIRADK